MKKPEHHPLTKEEHPVLQITQIEFKRGTGDRWAKGFQKQWNTSMAMCAGYLGGKILRNCENPDKFMIYTEWESHRYLNNYMFKEEYKWYRITDTDDDVVHVQYERYELDQDCLDPEVMVPREQWKSDLRNGGYPAREPYYRSLSGAGNGVPSSKKRRSK